MAVHSRRGNRLRLRGPRRQLWLAAGSLALAGALACLGAGVTFARLSASEASAGNSFTAGTVTLSSPTAVQSCALSGVQPGNRSGTATLATGLSPNTAYTYLTVYSLARAVASGDKLLVGTGNTTIIVTASGAASAATTAVTIPVASFTPASTFAAGSLVTDLTSENIPCTFTVTYRGNAPAYAAADVLFVGGSTGHAALWDNTPGGLQLVAIDQSNNLFSAPTTTLSSCSSASSEFTSSLPSGAVTCGERDNDVLTTTPISNGASYTLSVNWALAATAAGSYTSGTAQVVVAFHVVQSTNNVMHCTQAPGTGTVGQPCTPAGNGPSPGFTWS